jgi:hypothetical protein
MRPNRASSGFRATPIDSAGRHVVRKNFRRTQEGRLYPVSDSGPTLRSGGCHDRAPEMTVAGAAGGWSMELLRAAAATQGFDAHYHDQVGQAIPAPAPEPANLPVAEVGAQRNRRPKAKVFRFQLHSADPPLGSAHSWLYPGGSVKLESGLRSPLALVSVQLLFARVPCKSQRSFARRSSNPSRAPRNIKER